MSSFSLTNPADRDALIASLKERGIEAFKSGFTHDVSALAGGSIDVIAYVYRDGVVRVYATGPNIPRICSGGRTTFADVVDTFAGLFGLCEQGDAGRYAAKTNAEAAK